MVARGKNLLMNVKEWTGSPVQDLLSIAYDRPEWQALSAALSVHACAWCFDFGDCVMSLGGIT